MNCINCGKKIDKKKPVRDYDFGLCRECKDSFPGSTEQLDCFISEFNKIKRLDKESINENN